MSQLPPDIPVSSEIYLAIAPIYIGNLASWLLAGISVVQLYIYIKNSKRDSLHIKAVVYLVFALDAAQSIFGSVQGWHLFISGYGRPGQILIPGWTFSAIPGIDGPIAFIVQIFYVWRIRVLKGWTIIPSFIALISLGSLISAWIASFGLIKVKNLEDVRGFPVAVLWLGGAAIADIIIASCMVYILVAAKRNVSAFNVNTDILDRLIAFSIETGAVTAACALCELILFIANNKTNVHALFALILGKFYANSLYASLNGRRHIRGPAKQGEVSTLNFGASSGGRSTTYPGTGSDGLSGGTTVYSSAPAVHVRKEQTVFADSDGDVFEMQRAKDGIDVSNYGEDPVENVGRPSFAGDAVV